MFGNGSLRVLTYHRVANPDSTPGLDPRLASATPADFRAQMEHLARHYRAIPLEMALAAYLGETVLPPKAVLVTFDDAYRDFGEVAWPILRKLGVPATLFVPTAYPGHAHRRFWWDGLHRLLNSGLREEGEGSSHLGPSPHMSGGLSVRELLTLRRELTGCAPEALVELFLDWAERRSADGAPEPRSTILDWEDLRALRSDGVTLGAHTRWHPALTHVTEDRIREELRGSLLDLRREVGPVPAVVAYPYGFHDDRVVRIAREEGFELGFTCLDGLSRVGRTDPLRIHRTDITRRTGLRLFRLRMRPWFVPIDRWRHGRTDSSARVPVRSLDEVRGMLQQVVPLLG